MSVHAPFVKNPAALKTFSLDEVKKHNSEASCWVIIDSYVFDLTKFVDMHPGGAYVLLADDVAGLDCTEYFFGLHKSEILLKYSRLVIGQIVGQKSTIDYPLNGQLSSVPYAEPAWLSKAYHSPYFTDDHRNLAMAMRKFVDETLSPEAKASEITGTRPSKELVDEMSRTNILHMRLGPGKHLNGLVLPGGMKGENFDYLAELVVTQELARMQARGFQDGLSAGMWIGLTPILNFGTQKQKDAIIPAVLSGQKHICLAISEPFAGSDVAGVKTTATLTPDGRHFVVNGVKKWITNGIWSDYFTTAVKTEKGMTMLLIPRIEGVETKPIKTSYSAAAGTTYITFDNVMVPVENVIGKVDEGFRIVLSNFNHERLVMVHFATRQLRLVTEHAFKWAHLRKVFGKPLIEQPVIRQKFAAMFARCEAAQHWDEHVTYNMTKMSYAEQSANLAGEIALLKTFVTRCAHEVSDDAVQIFGGRGITRGGMGALIEENQRTYKFDAILGGSEEILGDLGVKQASRKMKRSVL